MFRLFDCTNLFHLSTVWQHDTGKVARPSEKSHFFMPSGCMFTPPCRVRHRRLHLLSRPFSYDPWARPLCCRGHCAHPDCMWPMLPGSSITPGLEEKRGNSSCTSCHPELLAPDQSGSTRGQDRLNSVAVARSWVLDCYAWPTAVWCWGRFDTFH